MLNILTNGYSRVVAYGIQKEKLKKNIKMILQLLTESYDRGCGQAAWMISLMHMEGVFGSADSQQEFLWAGRSAELGTEEGLIQLGDCYYFGRGTKQNTELARKYYKLASADGSNEANVRLGLLAFDNKNYTKSLSSASLPPWMLYKNYTESSKWFELAKKQGSVVTDAVEIICEIFKNGQKKSIYGVSDSLKKNIVDNRE